MSSLPASTEQKPGFAFLRRSKIGVPISRWQRLLEMMLLLLAFAIVLWVTAVFSNRYALGLLSDRGEQRLSLYASSLQSGLEKFDYLPEMLSVEPKLLSLLDQPTDAGLVGQVNLLLEKLNDLAGTSATYLMDQDGLTIAASNWRAEAPFVGKNFQFRPYFQMAMKGEKGRYFAQGITSQKPGYFISYPVISAQVVVGVVVVKVGIDELEKRWARTKPDDRVIVTDENGVIFISSHRDWKYRSLYPIAEDIREEIIRSRQYDDAQLLPLPTRIAEETTDGNPILNITVQRQSDSPKLRQYLVQTSNFAGTGWTIQLLSDIASTRPVVSVALLVAGSVFVVILIVLLYVFQRRQVTHERWIADQREQAALKVARDELEENVRQRTLALTETNMELRTAQTELIQASKLAALGKMSAGVTHELNQPMAAIRSYADNAAALINMDREAEAVSNLKIISELTDRVGRITGQLKMFARKETPAVQSISLKNALDSSLMQLMPRIREENVEIEQDIPEGRIWVMGGILRLEQILINLIRNALDAMVSGGSAEKKLAIKVREEGDAVFLSIDDTGPGIQPELQSKLFDPFFTTKPTGQGLGLGLSITLGLVKELGGTITAQNNAGGGACFQVKLRRGTGGVENASE